MDAVSIAFIIVASLMVVGGVLALIGRYAQVKKWTRVVGRVVTYEKDPNPIDGVPFCRPVIEMTAGDHMVTWRPDGYSYPPDYKVGDLVPMLYDPSDPSSALIDKPQKWIWPTLIFLAGVFLLVVAAGVELGILTTD